MGIINDAAAAPPLRPITTSQSTQITNRHTMALLRHAAAPLRSVRCLRTTPSTARSFSLTTRRQGGGGGQQFDPPTGWLWGVKPGEKPEPEGWNGPCTSSAVALWLLP